MSIKNKIAEVISFVFTPPLVTGAFFVFLMFRFAPDLKTACCWFAIAFLVLVLLPTAYVARLYRRGTIKDWHLAERQDRILPFTFVLAAAVVTTIAFYFIGAPLQVLAFLLGGILTVSALTLITVFWKVSAHTSTLAAVITAVFLFSGGRFGWLYLLLLPVLWARVVRQRHSIWQGIVGAVLAALVVGATLWMVGFRI